eukprot:363913-Chlamydomonas_euryale.AAC.13
MPKGAARPRLSKFSLTISNSFINRAPGFRLPIRRRMRQHTKANCKRLTVGTAARLACGFRPCDVAMSHLNAKGTPDLDLQNWSSINSCHPHLILLKLIHNEVHT